MAQARRRSEKTPTVILTIDRIGGGGDGIAEHEGRPVYVPLTVAGDVVRARLDGRRGDGLTASLVEIMTAGPRRQAPSCAHFGDCGGCALQHLDEESYRAWKWTRVHTALSRRGLGDVPITPVVSTPQADRRRATLAARQTAAGLVLGFNERRQHRIVDQRECPVLLPALAGLIPALRQVLQRILAPGEGADVMLAALDGGTDVTIVAKGDPDLAAREILAVFADEADLARIAWQTGKTPPEPVAQRRPCTVSFDGASVAVPGGAFLQASATGEAALTRNVLEAVDEAAHVGDLFAGLGTFTFPLARRSRVHAVDSDGDAVAALDAAARLRYPTGQIAVERRNLNRDPLSADELGRFDAVVFDPPRAGAGAQAAELARSAVPVVAGVSCNPISFARDAATLVAGGYALEGVTPVDQFLWSEHVELVGVFRR